MDQCTQIYLSQVSIDVEADEFMGCISQGVNVEPALSSTRLFQNFLFVPRPMSMARSLSSQCRPVASLSQSSSLTVP